MELSGVYEKIKPRIEDEYTQQSGFLSYYAFQVRSKVFLITLLPKIMKVFLNLKFKKFNLILCLQYALDIFPDLDF